MSTVDIVGIDLGTTKSAIAVWDIDSGQSRILPNREGKLITPSVVTFDPITSEAVVGEPAVQRMLADPGNVAYSIKRFIGRPPEDPWVAHDQRRMPYTIESDPQRRVMVKIAGRTLSPAELSAEVLRALTDAANEQLEQPITQVVISVPAYFNESQRRATALAGEHAGLLVARIIPEPTAAALAFDLGAHPTKVAVYDLGGGTFDVSVLDIKDGLFRVRAIGGDTHLGGDDFDAAVVEWLAKIFAEQHGGRQLPMEDKALRARLTEAAKGAKIALTDAEEIPIRLSGLLSMDASDLDLQVTLTRSQFEALIKPKIDETLEHVARTLARVQLAPEDIDQILLVGGQTRTPAVQDALRRRFGRPLNKSVNPEEAVARGAAVLGARLCGYMKDRIALWDVIPLSLGVELADGRMDVIIPAEHHLPAEKWRRGRQAFTTQKDNQSSIRFSIWQGERPMAADNAYVGEVVLPLTTARRAGEHRVDCLFKVDLNGILTVRAESTDSEGRPAEMTFTPGALTPAEIESYRKAAEKHRQEDELKRQLFTLSDEIRELRETCQGRMPDDPIWLRLDDAETAIGMGDVDRARHLTSEARAKL